MKILLTFLFLSLSILSFSQPKFNNLVYCVKIEFKHSGEKSERIYNSPDQVKQLYYELYKQKIDINKEFTGLNLFFEHKNSIVKLRCELRYINEKGKIRKIKTVKY